MAIRKKNTRIITCNGKQFRTVISPANDVIRFVAVGLEGNGRKIQVTVKSDIDLIWLKFPDISDLSELNLKIITPKEAASFILHALKDGWNPDEKGAIIKYKLTDEGLLRE